MNPRETFFPKKNPEENSQITKKPTSQIDFLIRKMNALNQKLHSEKIYTCFVSNHSLFPQLQNIFNITTKNKHQAVWKELEENYSWIFGIHILCAQAISPFTFTYWPSPSTFRLERFIFQRWDVNWSYSRIMIIFHCPGGQCVLTYDLKTVSTHWSSTPFTSFPMAEFEGQMAGAACRMVVEYFNLFTKDLIPLVRSYLI
jgi:hypothetical protein